MSLKDSSWMAGVVGGVLGICILTGALRVVHPVDPTLAGCFLLGVALVLFVLSAILVFGTGAQTIRLLPGARAVEQRR